nr:hypothetical protein [Tanacetum cinerariifolium]
MTIDTNVTEPVNITDFLCHNYVLNGLVDSLYHVYYMTTTAKELWESLERKYKTEDAATKKFVVHDIHAEEMTLTETFQVAAIIEKLPPSWPNSMAKGKGKDKNDKKSKGKAEYLAPKAEIVKQKFQGTCYNCDQPGHRAANCKMTKRVNPRHANMVNDNMDMIAIVMTIDTNVTEPVNITDFLCHNYVLNGLVDSLYHVYYMTTTAKELWESLERKYKTEDAATKKFVVHDIHAEEMTLTETFQVAAIIEKLPPSWPNSMAKGKGKDKNDKKSKGKAEYLAPKAEIVKQKFQGTCYNCDQPGHRAANCKMTKRVNPRHANMVNDNMDMIAIVSVTPSNWVAAE